MSALRAREAVVLLLVLLVSLPPSVGRADVALEAVEETLFAGGRSSHAGRALAIDGAGRHVLVGSRDGVDAFVRTQAGWELASRWRPIEPIEDGVVSLAVDPSGEIAAAGVHVWRAPFVVVLARGEREWSRVATLRVPRLGAGSGFGLAVSVSDHGDRIAVGAPLAEGGRGLAVVFRRRGVEWIEESAGGCQHPVPNERVGASLALDRAGTRLVVGAPLGSRSAVGRACLSRWDGERWRYEVELDAPDLTRGARFGSAVAIDETTVVVGAPRDLSSRRGSAHVFSLHEGGWSRVARIAGDELGRFELGRSLSVASGRVVLGSSGGAIVVRTTASVRVELEPVRSGAAAFGALVAISGDGRRVLVGAPDDDLEHAEDAGTVALYGLSGVIARDLPPSPRLASMDPSRTALHALRAQARRQALASRVGAQMALGLLLVGTATAIQVGLHLDARACAAGSCGTSANDARDVGLVLTPTLYVVATMGSTLLLGDALGGRSDGWVVVLAATLGAGVAAGLVHPASTFDPPITTIEGVAWRVGGHAGAALLVLGACVLAYGLADEASSARFDAPDLVPVITADPEGAIAGLVGTF